MYSTEGWERPSHVFLIRSWRHFRLKKKKKTICSRARGACFLPSISDIGGEENSAEIQFVGRNYFSSGLLHG